MSDDDGDFMLEEDGDLDFDYEDDDEDVEEAEMIEGGEQGSQVNLENRYYNTKGLAEQSPLSAIQSFLSIFADAPNTEWGYKGLKQSIKHSFRLGRFDDCLGYYTSLLEFNPSVITRNYAEKSVNNLLDFTASPTVSMAATVNSLTSNDESTSPSSSPYNAFLEAFYAKTLEVLSSESYKNERLLTKTNLKLARLLLDRGEFPRLVKLIKKLHASCQSDEGSGQVDQKKGTLLLEIYAIEIQMYTRTKNTKRLKEIYMQCLAVKSGIAHPKIMGIIRECGGKMHLRQKEWTKAQTDFFEAFKNYDESGSPHRIACLKYLVLTSMLMESEINPFDSQEAKSYKNDPQITAMTDLVSAYQRKEIQEFERILHRNKSSIMSDPFIRDHIEQVLKNIRQSVIVDLIKPYTIVTISYLAKCLNISDAELEELLVGLILEGRVSGKIDQFKGIVSIHQGPAHADQYSALEKWATSLSAIMKTALKTSAVSEPFSYS